MSYKWEGNYQLAGVGEVLLEATVVRADLSVCPGGIEMEDVRAFDEGGVEILLTDEQLEQIQADTALFERIDDAWWAATEAMMERRR